MRSERRPVGGKVVGQVLAEEGLACLDAAFGVTRAAIANAAFDPEGEQPFVIEGRGRQVGEHASVAPSLSDRSIDGPAWRQAQVSRWMGCALSGGRWYHV